MCSCTFMLTLSSSHSTHSSMAYIFVLGYITQRKKKHDTKPLTVPGFSMLLLHGPSTYFECFATCCVLHLFVGMQPPFWYHLQQQTLLMVNAMHLFDTRNLKWASKSNPKAFELGFAKLIQIRFESYTYLTLSITKLEYVN